MAKKEKYRLQPLLQVKERNKRKSEIELAKSISALKEEERRLKQLEDEKNQILANIEKTRKEMANMVGMGESRVADSQTRLLFIKKLKEDEKKKDEEIELQKEAIKRAEERVAQAKRDYIDACKEVKVMEKHKELWKKKIRQELEKEEAKLMNELGNVIHQLRKMS
jgi:Flagellar FliJ protein.